MPTAYIDVDATSSDNGELPINTSAANSGNKRRRTSDDLSHLTHLPSDQLVNIADYLSKTSRALFAVALTAPSSSFRKMGWRVEHSALHAASRAIISSAIAKPTRRGIGLYRQQVMENYYTAGWEQLDLPFDMMDLERDIDVKLAAKIKDDDIGAVLVCTDAKNTLKKIRLRRCDGVAGHGLEPIRRSVVLEEFNASESIYRRVYNTSLSEAAVAPILESIIDTNGNNLRKVYFPSKWCTGESRNVPPLSEFFTKFNALMLSKVVKCVCCSELCEGNNENSCQVCCKRICADCDNGEDELGEASPFIRSCDQCSKNLCESCGGEHRVCSRCDSVYCSLCAKDDGVDAGQYCESESCENGSLAMDAECLKSSMTVGDVSFWYIQISLRRRGCLQRRRRGLLRRREGLLRRIVNCKKRLLDFAKRLKNCGRRLR